MNIPLRDFALQKLLVALIWAAESPCIITASEIEVAPVPAPVQMVEPIVSTRMARVNDLVGAGEVREAFGVSGQNLTVAVLDTGIRATHHDIQGRVLVERNYTSDNGGAPNVAADGHGHGSNVTGIIAGNGTTCGIAPGAGIAALKVLDNTGRGTFANIEKALQWVLDNHQKYGITVVNLSIVDGGNHTSRSRDTLQEKIQALRRLNIPVVAAAGNAYYTHSGREGMSYPAIFSETVSVGAVFATDAGDTTYACGARAFSSSADRLAPFSQRYSESLGNERCTDLFAPGAPIVSMGILNDSSLSIQSGTSQATPVVSGAILLLQQAYLRQFGELPSVDRLENALRNGSIEIWDGDDENDNVAHTQSKFRRLDMPGAFRSLGVKGRAPLILSGPIAQPSPAAVGMPMTFSAKVLAHTNGPISYLWNFGDGSTSTAEFPSHAYSESGSYFVSLTVTTEHGSAQGGMGVEVEEASELQVRRFQAALKFTAAGRDSLQVQVNLQLTHDFIASGTRIYIRLDGVSFFCTLNSQGHGKSQDGRATITLTRTGLLTLKATRLSLTEAWQDHGFHNYPKASSMLTLPMNITVGAAAYAGDLALNYSNKSGRVGYLAN